MCRAGPIQPWSFDREPIHRRLMELFARMQNGTRDIRMIRRIGKMLRLERNVSGRTVILVDDGLATGSTMRAAVQALRRAGPRRVVVAVPTAAPSTCEEFQTIADACVCTITPEPFRAVGLWYENFDQISDEEVCHLLFRARLDSGREPPQDLRLLPAGSASQPAPH